MPKQRWHKSSRNGLLFPFWGGSGLVLMNWKEPSQVPWGIPWLHRQPNAKQRCVQFWVSHSPFWCWIPAWHCAINSDIKDPETQGPLCNSGFGLGQTNKQTNMFGLGHLPMAEPYYSFGPVSLTSNSSSFICRSMVLCTHRQMQRSLWGRPAVKWGILHVGSPHRAQPMNK